MLAEALCKLEGFTYAPSDAIYWQQGHSRCVRNRQGPGCPTQIPTQCVGNRTLRVRQDMLQDDTARVEEWPALSSGYCQEIERMQGDIRDYLLDGAQRLPHNAVA